MEFKLDITIKDKKIIQELFKKEDSIINKIHTWIIDTKEKSINDALIKLGWTPPSSKKCIKRVFEVVKYRHYKGGIYHYICDATLEWCPDNPGSHVIIYEGADGRRWVRPRNEFFGYTSDGVRRFEKIE